MYLHALIFYVPLPSTGIAGITFGQGPSHFKHNLQGDVHATPGDLQLLTHKKRKLKKTHKECRKKEDEQRTEARVKQLSEASRGH